MDTVYSYTRPYNLRCFPLCKAAEEGKEDNGAKTSDKKKTTKNNNSKSPRTGDIAIEILIALMAISGLGIVVILKRNKRK